MERKTCNALNQTVRTPLEQAATSRRRFCYNLDDWVDCAACVLMPDCPVGITIMRKEAEFEQSVEEMQKLSDDVRGDNAADIVEKAERRYTRGDFQTF